ncbi:MAG: polysaccharide deacetylase family protein [Planctomycetes bacterium]|nr:polysaccharide deacetylase family protein [Planctomycetota bacterium]MCC7397368.1 polysaccharide deacetylase family protein [Planctomycetota bacterium]
MHLLPILYAVLGAAVAYWVLPWLWLRDRKRQLLVRCREQRAIAVTFDDGPSRELTSAITAELAAAELPASFFLLGVSVQGNEDIVRNLIEQGHQVGCHGEGHVHHWKSPPWAGLVDTYRGLRRLERVTGLPAAAMQFRPPFGKLNLLSLLFVWWHRTPIVMWTHDGHDTRTDRDLTPAELADGLRATGGGVLLLHDFHRHIEDERAQVVDKLQAVLALRHEGFRFVRLRDLLAAPRQPASRTL